MKIIDHLKKRLKDRAREWIVRDLPPLGCIDPPRLKLELDALSFGMRCMMALGGHKVWPPGLNETEVRERGDSTVALCANLHIMVRCAESVLARHGLEDEYRAQLKKAENDLNAVVKRAVGPTNDELVALQAMLKAGQNGGKSKDVQGPSGESGRPVDQGSVRDHSGESTEGR